MYLSVMKEKSVSFSDEGITSVSFNDEGDDDRQQIKLYVG